MAASMQLGPHFQWPARRPNTGHREREVAQQAYSETGRSSLSPDRKVSLRPFLLPTFWTFGACALKRRCPRKASPATLASTAMPPSPIFHTSLKFSGSSARAFRKNRKRKEKGG